jgi:hypothetical protein
LIWVIKRLGFPLSILHREGDRGGELLGSAAIIQNI